MAAIIDMKSCSSGKREQVRRKAYDAFKSGTTAHTFAKEHRMYSATVYQWYKKFSKDGISVVTEKKRGAARYSRAVLDENQMKKLQKTVVDKNPDQLKFDFALWNSKAIHEYIEETWHVTLCRRTVRRYMNKLGFTSQCPIKYAREQNPALVARWLNETYPEIKKEAHEVGAKIMWSDETCALAGEIRTHGYAPKGHSPVLRQTTNQSVRCQMTSAIGNTGDLFFMFHEKATNTDIFKDFIQRLQKEIKQPIFLIVDNLRVHHAKLLKEWLKEEWKKHQFKLFYLPGYSPELNSDEYLNRDVKARLPEVKIPQSRDELPHVIKTHLDGRKANKEMIKHLFQKEEVCYAS